MKRSKMIKIMKGFINDKVQHRDAPEQAEYYANKLLEIMQGYGMAPPFVDKYDFETGMFGHQWEDEEDENET